MTKGTVIVEYIYMWDFNLLQSNYWISWILFWHPSVVYLSLDSMFLYSKYLLMKTFCLCFFCNFQLLSFTYARQCGWIQTHEIIAAYRLIPSSMPLCMPQDVLQNKVSNTCMTVSRTDAQWENLFNIQVHHSALRHFYIKKSVVRLVKEMDQQDFISCDMWHQEMTVYHCWAGLLTLFSALGW